MNNIIENNIRIVHNNFINTFHILNIELMTKFYISKINFFKLFNEDIDFCNKKIFTNYKIKSCPFAYVTSSTIIINILL